MIKLSEKNRKILRAIYRGLGVVAASSVFFSCPIINGGGWAAYGMPPDYIREELQIFGLVKAKETGVPIRGIAIYVEGITNHSPHVTHTLGEFYIWVPKQDNYTIIFTDIDGENNGGRFKQVIRNLTREEIEALSEVPLIIEMELEEETNDEG